MHAKSIAISLTATILFSMPGFIFAEAIELKNYPHKNWDSRFLELKQEEMLFIDPGWRQIFFLLPPPGVQKTQQEIDDLHLLKQFRAARADEIKEEIISIEYRFLRVVNEKAEDAPALMRLLKQAIRDTTIVVMHFKDQFLRARPWMYDEKLEPTIAPPGHPAYPSGHATQSYVVSQILSAIYKSDSIALEEAAYQIAKNREIGGVHYQSDSDAGLVLARQIVSMMRNNRYFKLALSAAETEHENNLKQ